MLRNLFLSARILHACHSLAEYNINIIPLKTPQHQSLFGEHALVKDEIIFLAVMERPRLLVIEFR